MSENRVLFTQEGHDRLKGELDRLLNEEMPDLLRRLKEARAHGDLSENAEYHAVKERKAGVEARVHLLKVSLSRAEVFAPDPKVANGTCVFGSVVRLRIERDGEKPAEREFRIVGDLEADTSAGRLSMSSPLGRELLGKAEGDLVDVEAPAGTINYEIVSISYGA